MTLFRWSFGDTNTSNMLPLDDKYVFSFISMLKTSIMSFHRFFPDDRFCVVYNGTDFKGFAKKFKKTKPCLGDLYVNVLNVYDFPNPYPFSPPSGVWWKWVPFRLSLDEAEISVDADIMCLSEPKGIRKGIEGDIPVSIIPDVCHSMSERSAGNTWAVYKDLLIDKRPINSGLLVLQPGVSFENEYLKAAECVPFADGWQNCHISRGTGKTLNSEDQKKRNSHFIDEQGCINVGLYLSGLKINWMDRDVCIYGHELMDRLERGFEVETVHFISGSKAVFKMMETPFFRISKDSLYTINDFREELSILNVTVHIIKSYQLHGLTMYNY